MIKNKGLWVLTCAGRAAYEQFVDPEQFMKEADRLYRQWAAERPEEPVARVDDASLDAATTLEEAEEAAWTEIEEHLEQMNPYDFQELVAGLLRGMGYHVAWVSPPGPDKGIDVIAHTDLAHELERSAESVSPDGYCCHGGFLVEERFADAA